MSSRFRRAVNIFSSTLLAVAYGLMAYASFALAEALTGVATWILDKPALRAIHRWDEWFFAILCGLASLGALGFIFRKDWARIISALAFAASGAWALLIGLAPESWRGVWFSTWVDRWVAALVILLSIAGLGWLFSAQAKNEFHRSKVAA